MDQINLNNLLFFAKWYQKGIKKYIDIKKSPILSDFFTFCLLFPLAFEIHNLNNFVWVF